MVDLPPVDMTSTYYNHFWESTTSTGWYSGSRWVFCRDEQESIRKAVKRKLNKRLSKTHVQNMSRMYKPEVRQMVMPFPPYVIKQPVHARGHHKPIWRRKKN